MFLRLIWSSLDNGHVSPMTASRPGNKAPAVLKTPLRSFETFLPDQPILSDLFDGTHEEYWAALFATICHASGARKPRDEFDLVESEMFSIEQMASNPIMLSFMRLLVKLSGAKRVLEIGCFVGLSTMNFARALPPGGKVITIDK